MLRICGLVFVVLPTFLLADEVTDADQPSNGEKYPLLESAEARHQEIHTP